MNRDSFQRNQDEKSKTRPLSESDAGSSPLRDSFQRQPGARQATRPLTAPLKGSDAFQRESETGALPDRPASGPLTTGGAQKALIEQTLVKAESLASSLEPRVELLLRAFQAVNMPVPGISHAQPKHALTPNTEKIVTYLSRALQLKPNLARQMAVAVFRYYEAAEMLAFTRQGLEADVVVEGTLEALKQKFYYLTTYHEEFKGDPILTQVFPPPKGHGGTQSLKRPGTAPLSTVDKLKERQVQMAAMQQAVTLQASLAPRVALMKLALGMQAASTARRLGAIFKPEDRLAGQIAKQIKTDPMLASQIQTTVTTYDQFAQALVSARSGGETGPLTAYVDTLQRLQASLSQHPALAPVFAARAPGSRELTPPPGQG